MPDPDGRALVLAALTTLIACTKGDECDTCEQDEDCKEGFFCTEFNDGSAALRLRRRRHDLPRAIAVSAHGCAGAIPTWRRDPATRRPSPRRGHDQRGERAQHSRHHRVDGPDHELGNHPEDQELLKLPGANSCSGRSAGS